MKIIKNEKGITMVSLVVTVILLIIIAGISINIGLDNMSQTEDKKLDEELIMMQQAILESYTKHNIQAQVVSQDLPGDKLTQYSDVERELGSLTIELILTNYENISEDAYYYKISTKEQFDKLGIKGASDSYIVNYVTGEVINITTPKKSDGNLLYLSK